MPETGMRYICHICTYAYVCILAILYLYFGIACSINYTYLW